MSEQTQKRCQLQRVYAKDISFEAPGTPDVFREEWDPRIRLQLNNGHQRLGESGDYEATVTATATAVRDEKTLYIAEATLAGIFSVQGLEGEELDQMLGIYCPNVLFPYLRETISSLVVRGSFPQFLMQPINFETLYRQAEQEEQQQSGQAGEGGQPS